MPQKPPTALAPQIDAMIDELSSIIDDQFAAFSERQFRDLSALLSAFGSDLEVSSKMLALVKTDDKSRIETTLSEKIKEVVFLLRKLKNVLFFINIIFSKFKTTVLESKKDREKTLDEIQHIGAPPKGDDALRRSFKHYLLDKGCSDKLAESASEHVSEFIETLPEMQAVKELRRQFRKQGNVTKGKPIYEGVRISGLASAFVLEHYKTEIEEGTLTTSALQEHDSLLHTTLYRERSREGKSLASFISPNGSALDRRISACATIIASSPEEAARFFSSLRPDRVKNNTAPSR